MVYSVQPMIVSAFNMIMGSSQKLAGILENIYGWLNSDDIVAQVTKWTSLSTVIGSVVGAFVHYRTGASLVQIAQMGLRKSILATVLGLESEKVANVGVLNAIKMKILGLKEEQISELSTKDAILGKVLGVNKETLAEQGLKASIIESVTARELDKIALEGATAKEIMNMDAMLKNNLARKSSIGIMSAQILKLKTTTYATYGFRVALLELTTQMEASAIASMGLTRQIGLLIASIGLPVAIIGAFVAALGSLVWQMHESAEQMKAFNNLVDNGQDIIKQNHEIAKTFAPNMDEQKRVKLLHGWHRAVTASCVRISQED